MIVVMISINHVTHNETWHASINCTFVDSYIKYNCLHVQIYSRTIASLSCSGVAFLAAMNRDLTRSSGGDLW